MLKLVPDTEEKSIAAAPERPSSEYSYSELERILNLRIELMTSRLILSCKKFNNPGQELMLAASIVKGYMELQKAETPAFTNVIRNEYERISITAHAIARLRMSKCFERAATVQKQFLREIFPAIWEAVGVINTNLTEVFQGAMAPQRKIAAA